MSNPIFVSIEGNTQGLITEGAFTPESVGNVYQEGHEDDTLVKSFKHNINVPRDSKTGKPTGQRSHGPLIITKMIDKSSPLLYNALTKGETLSKVAIKWYRTSAAGIPEHFFTIELEDAMIVDIDAKMNQVDFQPEEEISFSYRKVTWRHETASTSGEDDWKLGIGTMV